MSKSASPFLTLVLLAFSSAADAQGPTPVGARDGVIGMGFLVFSVASIEPALAFYRDVLGFALVNDPGEPRQAPSALLDEPGALFRVALLESPELPLRLELYEFSDVPRSPRLARPSDPGAVTLALTVADFDAVWRRLQETGVRRVSTHAATDSSGRDVAVIVRDPDGFMVELIRSPSSAESGRGVHDARIVVTVADIDASVSFYNDALGLSFNSRAPQNADTMIRDLSGVSDVDSIRSAEAMIPGTSVRLRLLQFTGAAGSAVRQRVQDPGAAALTLTVAALKGTLQLIDAHGGSIGSAAGQSLPIPPHPRKAWIRDPNGLLLLLSSPSSVL